MRSRHYSGTKLFNWIRTKVGIEKPYALGWGEWNAWNASTKAAHPVGWFLTETLPEWLEKPAGWLIDPLYEVKYYLTNRFVSKTHTLQSDLKPGKWHEFDTRMLHSLFNELINYVEIETAWSHIAWSDPVERAKYDVPWRYSHYLFRWRTWRCPQAGIDHMNWAATLTNDPVDGSDIPGEPTRQAITAKEVLELYNWWKNIRPTRGEAWEVSGLQAFWDKMDKIHGDGWLMRNAPVEEYDEYQKLVTAVDTLEVAWYDEDTEQLIRLIKIRSSLWT